MSKRSKNRFVPLIRRKVFAASGGKEIAACPFVNLPEKKDAHQMDRDNEDGCAGSNGSCFAKSLSTSAPSKDTCDIQNSFGHH
jgi:hypothetical protein